MNARRIQLSLLALAIALLVGAARQPQITMEQDTYRFVYVFDISQSMNVADAVTSDDSVTRLDFAKQAATASLRALPCDSEVGIALFTGHRAYLMLTPVEVCAHLLELSNVIDNVSWQMTWKLRSEIAKGVHKSILLMTQLANETRLVFFTDGHEAPPLHPDLKPTFTGEVGEVSGLLVGVGGEKLVPIPKFDKEGQQQGFWQANEVMHVDAFTASQNAREGQDNAATGTEHLSSLKQSYLQSLASDTGLDYHRLESAEGFATQLRGKRLGIPKHRATDIGWLLALLALASVLAVYLVPKVFRRSATR